MVVSVWEVWELVLILVNDLTVAGDAWTCMRHWVFWTSGRRTITLSSISLNNGSWEKNRTARGVATSSTPVDARYSCCPPIRQSPSHGANAGGQVAHWKHKVQGRTNDPSGTNEYGCVWIRHTGLLFEKFRVRVGGDDGCRSFGFQGRVGMRAGNDERARAWRLHDRALDHYHRYSMQILNRIPRLSLASTHGFCF